MCFWQVWELLTGTYSYQRVSLSMLEDTYSNHDNECTEMPQSSVCLFLMSVLSITYNHNMKTQYQSKRRYAVNVSYIEVRSRTDCVIFLLSGVNKVKGAKQIITSRAASWCWESSDCVWCEWLSYNGFWVVAEFLPAAQAWRSAKPLWDSTKLECDRIHLYHISHHNKDVRST